MKASRAAKRKKSRRKRSSALDKARVAELRLRAAIDAMPEGVVFLDRDKRYILWNARYAEIYHASADLFRPGARLADTLRVGVARGDYPDAIGHEDEWIAQRLAKLDAPGPPHEQRLADGRWILIEERKLPDGSTIGLRVDVTELKRKEESFRLLFENNPVPMFVYDCESRIILKANEGACAHYGRTRDDLVGRLIDDLRCQVPGDEPPEGVEFHRGANGVRIEVTPFAREFDDSGRACVLLACVDVTERRRAEANLAHLARHDALTGLPNRAFYRDQVEARLQTLKLYGQGFAVMLFDLDNFKAVNDTLGHLVGDELLREAAKRIQSCLGPGDLAARLGGDEFAVVHAGGEGEKLVAQLQAALQRPLELDGHILQIGASIGIAFAPEHGDDPERLLKSADLALYAAKADGRGAYRLFEPEMDAQLQARRRLETDLRSALFNGELSVHYQPLINLETGEMAGCEALLRWRHPEHGFVSPAVFVPIAEEAGLISAIGQFVLRQACADAARWPAHMKVAVNLSPAQFRGGAILELVVQALAAANLPPHRLDLEITEALLLERNDATLAALNGLRALGVGVSMDDFGTGYSSLIYLRNFPFTKIKIDQSFVRGVAESVDSQAIVRAIINLASSLGLTVLAEGVETDADLAYLRAAGCHEAQGFYFSKAVPVAELFPAPAEALGPSAQGPRGNRDQEVLRLGEKSACAPGNSLLHGRPSTPPPGETSPSAAGASGRAQKAL